MAHQNQWNALCRQLERNWYVLPADAPVDVTRQQIRAARHLLTVRAAGRSGQKVPAGTNFARGGGRATRTGDAAESLRAGILWGTESGDPLALAALLRNLRGEGGLELLPWGTASQQPALWHRQSGPREPTLDPDRPA